MFATVLGSNGFIGRNLVTALRKKGFECWLPERDDPELYRRPLGYVFYCIGLTADFRTRPFETVDAHVGVLRNVLQRANVDCLIYLSSTRVYIESTTTDENQLLHVAPFRSDDLYNLSKLLGESLTLASGVDCRVVRLSNVVGADMGATNFLGSILNEALKSRRVNFHTDLRSEKDYLTIDDAVDGLISIAMHGDCSIYNLASGVNVSHQEIANLLVKKGIEISVEKKAPLVTFPTISIKKCMKETGFSPKPIKTQLSELMERLLVW